MELRGRQGEKNTEEEGKDEAKVVTIIIIIPSEEKVEPDSLVVQVT